MNQLKWGHSNFPASYLQEHLFVLKAIILMKILIVIILIYTWGKKKINFESCAIFSVD